LTNSIAAPGEIVSFWRDAGSEKWWKKDAAFDRMIAERFGATHAEAAAGRLADWPDDREGALALILLLDQFSRHLFRGDPRAFTQDSMARGVANRAVDAGYDKTCDPALRPFFYLPFMHSEAIADQELCLRLFHALPGAANLGYAIEHERIIRRFGRFPHRNAILGRHTSPAERAFLDAGGFAG
jgi:uncharacterized protein (DUF924 family)